MGAVTLWSGLLGLVTTPFLIHRLGTSRYGIFAVIAIMAAYLSNLEFGFGQATIRFLARARGAGDGALEANVLRTSFSVFLFAGLAAAAIGMAAASPISSRFVHGTVARHGEVLGAVRLGALILVASFLASFASCALQALGRFQAVVRTRAVFTTAASASAVIAVAAGGRLVVVLLAQAAVAFSQCLVLLATLSRASAVPLRPRVDAETLRTMARYGILILLSGLATQAILQGPPTVLAGYSSTVEVAAFSVPNLALAQLATVASSTSFGFLPFVSAMSLNPDRRHLRDVYRSNLRLTLLIMGPVTLYLAIFSRVLLTAWIGSGFAGRASGAMAALCGVALLLALSTAPADVVRGLGRPSWLVVYTGVCAALSIGVAFALAPVHGAAGAAIALLVALAVTTIPFAFVVAQRLLTMPAAELVRAAVGPFAAVACAGGLYLLGRALGGGLVPAIITGVAATTVYAAAAYLLVMDDRERDVFRRLRTSLPTRAEPCDGSAVDLRPAGHSLPSGALPAWIADGVETATAPPVLERGLEGSPGDVVS